MPEVEVGEGARNQIRLDCPEEKYPYKEKHVTGLEVQQQKVESEESEAHR